MRKTVVYLACPMRLGIWENNVRTAALVAKDLMTKGYSVINPVGSWLSGLVAPMPPEQWLDNNYGLIDVSDCVFRIPGKSIGADHEADYAVRSEIPLFTDLQELYATMELTQEDRGLSQDVIA